MAYNEAIYELKEAWYKRLDINFAIPVFKDGVPATQDGNYVVVRSDGLTDLGPTNSGWFKSVVIVVEIVTKFPVICDTSVASSYAQTVNNAVMYWPNEFNLPIQNHLITQITLQSQDEIYEDNDSEKIFRIIKRFEHFLTQK